MTAENSQTILLMVTSVASVVSASCGLALLKQQRRQLLMTTVTFVLDWAESSIGARQDVLVEIVDERGETCFATFDAESGSFKHDLRVGSTYDVNLFIFEGEPEPQVISMKKAITVPGANARYRIKVESGSDGGPEHLLGS